MSIPKIGIAGNQWITEYLINKLISVDMKPSLIINMDNTWEDEISGYIDLAEKFIDKNIKIYRPKTYNLGSIQDKDFLISESIDILIVFGWQRLIPKWYIDSIPFGVWGVHGGPEKPPRCRGRAVFNWSLILGYKKFYMYLFKITPEIDEGEIAEIRVFDILDSDDILTLYHKNCVVSAKMFLKNIPKILNGTINLQLQDSNKKATYLPKRISENGGINWHWDSKKLVNFVRALAPPYPGAFTEINGVRVFIYKMQIFDKRLKFSFNPGTIIDIFPNDDFIVSTIDYPVYVSLWESKEVIKFQSGMEFVNKVGIQISDPEI